jgi:DNA polymerase-1
MRAWPSAAGADTTIVSSDKDLMQLVGPERVDVRPDEGSSQIGVPEVIEKWGVPPEKMIDLQSLTGDATDNVPGVPGIGPRPPPASRTSTATSTRCSPAPARSSRRSAARRSSPTPTRRAVAPARALKTDVPVDRRSDEIVLQPPDGPKLIAFLKGHGIHHADAPRRRGDEATERHRAGEVPVVPGAEARGDATRRRARPALVPADGRRSAAAAATPVRHRRSTTRLPRPGRGRGRRGARSTIPATRRIRDRERSTPGSPRRARPASSASTPRRPRSIRCRPSSSASRWRCRQNPGRAYIPCRPPLHKTASATFWAAGCIRRQIPIARPRRLKPLLEDASVLKVAQNLKYDWLVMRRHGIDRARSTTRC